MSIGIGRFPANTLIPLQRLLLSGLASPPPRTKSAEPPRLAHVVGWFMPLAFGFGTFAPQKTELPRLTTVC